MNTLVFYLKRIHAAIIRKILWIKLQTAGYKSMKKLDMILQKDNITYWITSGTLLGAYRENRFIKSDLDIDLAIHSNDLHKLIEFTKVHNITIRGVTKINGEISELSFFYGGIKYDIFLAYKSGDNEYISVCWDKQNSGGKRLNVARMFFPKVTETQRIKLNGIHVSAPKDIDKYLKINYGENYMDPDPNWRFFKDLKPPALYYDVNELYGYYDDKL